MPEWLVDDLLHFGTSNGTGDPLRWTPVNVEILLDDWFPSKIVADETYLRKLPDLLRAFIEFSHDRLGIRRKFRFENAVTGAAGLVARYLEGNAEDEVLAELERAVGGPDALENLTTEALPDEPFDWTGVSDDIRDRVAEILRLCDEHADDMLDVEHRTAERRLLSRLAVAAPGPLARGSARTAAAAVVWLIARANESTRYDAELTVAKLLAPFGVSSVSQRAQGLLRALGVPETRPGEVALETTDLLVGRRRADILAERDYWRNQ